MSELRARLQKFGITAKRRFGQNFLHDRHALQTIAKTVATLEPEAILEIGPGPATLTDHLAALETPMVAVERDRGLVTLLRHHFAESDQIRIVEGDILQFAPAEAFGPNVKPVVVGNIPYNISSPILLHLIGHRASIGPAVLMLQAELAERLRAPVGSRQSGSMTVLLALLASVRRVLSLPPAAFSPPPKVRSEVLELKWHPEPAVEVSSVSRFERLVRAGFGQRRKTLKNALGAIMQQGVIRKLAEQTGVDLGRRAETLFLSEWGVLERCWEGLEPEGPKP